MEESMDKIAPIKHVIIPSHKIWKEPWITKGLSKLMSTCTQLYRNSLKNNASLEIRNKYRSYRKCLTKLKCTAKVNYYINKCYCHVRLHPTDYWGNRNIDE